LASEISLKIPEMIRGIVKRMQGNASSIGGLRLTVAFIAGMVTMTALAQIPVVADIFSHQLTHNTVVPVLPEAPDSLKPNSNPDTSNPVESHMTELVWTTSDEAALPC
jgi:hypothetical protein